MYKQICGLQDKTGVLLTCVDNMYTEYLVQEMCMKRFDCNSAFTSTVESVKELHAAISHSEVQPLLGSRWLFVVNAEKIPSVEWRTFFKHASTLSLFIIVCHSYREYKNISKSQFINSVPGFVAKKYFCRFSKYDIYSLYSYYMAGVKTPGLSENLLSYVAKGYGYDTEAVCTLFDNVRSGKSIKSEADIVNLVGIGGNTVDFTVLHFLTTSCKTARGVKTARKRLLRYVYDLLTRYNDVQLYNMLKRSVYAYIELKELYITGDYCDAYKNVPDCFNGRAISRLRRFDYMLSKVSFPLLLSLNECLDKYQPGKVGLVQFIYDFLDLQVEVNSKC